MGAPRISIEQHKRDWSSGEVAKPTNAHLGSAHWSNGAGRYCTEHAQRLKEELHISRGESDCTVTVRSCIDIHFHVHP